MVYHLVDGNHMGTNCVLLIADIYFCIPIKGILCLAFTNLNGSASYTYLMTHLDMLICSLLIILNLRNIFRINIPQNFS